MTGEGRHPFLQIPSLPEVSQITFLYLSSQGRLAPSALYSDASLHLGAHSAREAGLCLAGLFQPSHTFPYSSLQPLGEAYVTRALKSAEAELGLHELQRQLSCQERGLIDCWADLFAEQFGNRFLQASALFH